MSDGEGEKSTNPSQIPLFSLKNLQKTEWIMEYLSIVNELKADNKLPIESKLQKLLTPLCKLQSVDDSDYPDCKYPFVDDSYIDLENELDLEILTPNPEKYSIIGDFILNKFGHLRTDYELISLNDNAPSPRSIHQIWGQWRDHEICKHLNQQNDAGFEANDEDLERIRNRLLSGKQPIEPYWKLDQEIMKSGDLLDQILICYTIKRALNGDKTAITKLCSLYEKTAIDRPLNFSGRLEVKYPSEDLKPITLNLLRLIIRGFKPADMLKAMLEGEKISPEGVPWPKWITDFFVYYYLEYIPSLLRDKPAFSIILETLLDPATIINNDTSWQKITGKGDLSKIINRFNRFAFRPGIVKMGPRKNLTTWLFGVEGKRQYGKLYQLLKEILGTSRKSRIETINRDLESFANQAPEASSKDLDVIIKELTDKDFSTRDSEIFTLWKFDKRTQVELGKQFSLSERQIRRICYKVLSKLEQ